MKQIEVGIRMGADGISFVGLEEANALIAQGGRVVSVEAGGALVDRVDSADGQPQFTLAGCTLIMNLTS